MRLRMRLIWVGWGSDRGRIGVGVGWICLCFHWLSYISPGHARTSHTFSIDFDVDSMKAYIIKIDADSFCFFTC